MSSITRRDAGRYETGPGGSEPPYVLLASSGRSGSNNLLDILDCHPDTICRSEPRGRPGAVFNRLPEGRMPRDLGPDFLPLWRAVIAEAAMRNGSLDHFRSRDKSWFRHPLLGRLFQPVFGSVRARRLMGRILPAYAGEEWPIPAVYASGDRLRRAVPVFKLTCVAAWIGNAIDAEPRMRIVHNIRSPQGFLASWYNRFALRADGGPEALLVRNRQTLAPVLAHYAADWPHGEAHSLSALLDSELWRWRFFNEAVLAFADRPAQYMTVFYDDVMDDRVAVAARVMAFCGLEPDAATVSRVAGLGRTLFTAPHRESLDPGVLDAAVGRVLAGSAIAAVFAAAGRPL
jgi:hypothetical protein